MARITELCVLLKAQPSEITLFDDQIQRELGYRRLTHISLQRFLIAGTASGDGALYTVKVQNSNETNHLLIS